MKAWWLLGLEPVVFLKTSLCVQLVLNLPLCKYDSVLSIYWLVTVLGRITVYIYSHEPIYTHIINYV